MKSGGSAPRPLWPLALSLAALAYAIAVVVVAWRAPDKGFLAFTGRRIVDVTPGGPAQRAGLERGDVLRAIDGMPVRSTLEYAQRLLRRRPGVTVVLDLERAGQPVRAVIQLGRSPAPVSALVASGLAAVLCLLGLVARYGRPDDVAARRFWRSTVLYAIVYAGGLSWTHLVVHPVLSAVFGVMLFLAPPLGMDFGLSFPQPLQPPVRGWRALGWAPTLVLGAGTALSLAIALGDLWAGRPGDRALSYTVRFVSWQLAFSTVVVCVGMFAQYRHLRRVGASGRERGQLKWLFFGFALCLLPMLFAVPFAIADLDWFLTTGYRPFLVAIAILWFATASLAVLGVRLADVDAVIKRSVAYAIASGCAAGIYFLMVLAVGLLADWLFGRARLWPPLVAGVAAAMLFGPIRARVTHWLDRRFFRDRLHYVQALRELSEALTRVREPADLAREIVDRTVETLRASSGALYLASHRDSAADLELAHARGGAFAARLPRAQALTPPEDGVAVPIAQAGVLVLGARLGGDLYGTQDRDLLGALAGQLAVALDNARAFGTIAGLGRTLEAQNLEIRELRDKLEDENVYLRGRLDATRDGAALIGSSKVMRELERQMERAASTSALVLLHGESGSGKGLVARTLHTMSSRAHGRFIHLDCAAIPPGVFESELFGHERGSFTGAVRTRRGPFELADGGTLFLDEIGELPLGLQPKLLRVLQERSVVRVGGGRPVEVDVRIVVATNRNLSEMVARGEFREDLYFRLRVIEIEVPPLRTHKSDIPALCEYLLPRLCRRDHRPPRTLSPEAMARLCAYGWPGNVRELENVLERAVVLCESDRISADDLAVPDVPAPVEAPPEPAWAADATHHRDVMESIEKRRLVAALRAAGGNQSHAARALGIARTTLINKLRRYGLL
ncbi:MAG TPA: sigma 54-interacting transcriptional regulator [Polyangia bacterium]|nr:sigma 54-interacting transcriptional regulator [Polyangia bacterium]